MKLKVNNQIPEAKIFYILEGQPKEESIKEVFGTKKVILFGLPGAFTSTCSKLHLPGFISNAKKSKIKELMKFFV